MEFVDRPAKNTRTIHSPSDWDTDLEEALLSTRYNQQAVKTGLALFHSSPAKGRLWMKGYKVKHRVMPDRQHVLAWLEG